MAEINLKQWRDSMNRIMVRFENADHGKEYCYFCDIEVYVGDVVVVHARDTFSVAYVSKVHGIYPNQASKASKWVIQKVDVAAHEERLRIEALKQEIKNKLATRKEQMQEYMIYKQLAKDDPEINNLLLQLGEIDPTCNLIEPPKENN